MSDDLIRYLQKSIKSRFIETLTRGAPFEDQDWDSETDENFSRKLEYLWENHSNSFNLAKKYRIIKNYESLKKKSSEDLWRQWVTGRLRKRDIDINDWLLTYMQIKDFIK